MGLVCLGHVVRRDLMDQKGTSSLYVSQAGAASRLTRSATAAGLQQDAGPQTRTCSGWRALCSQSIRGFLAHSSCSSSGRRLGTARRLQRGLANCVGGYTRGGRAGKMRADVEAHERGRHMHICDVCLDTPDAIHDAGRAEYIRTCRKAAVPAAAVRIRRLLLQTRAALPAPERQQR